ncbi:MAG: ferrochelatase [Nitrospiraceae bacterium]|nr:ferrochelatase [Nitrospiraceae bacterium]
MERPPAALNERGPIGVLLLNLGGPDSLRAVRPFLYNLFADRMIIRLGPAPLQKPIACAIAAWRAKAAKKAYALIGGKSPLAGYTGAQAAALEEALKPHGEFKVSYAMRYWRPYIRETAERMRADGVKKLIALSLYPQYSIATTGSSVHRLNEEARALGLRVGAIEHWCDHPLYIEALADTIKNGIASFGGGDVFVLFSAHGLPMKIVESGDPYVRHIRRTIDAVLERLPLPLEHALSYQSRTGPVKWLAPYTDEMLRLLAGRGVKKVLAVPVSFVSDHVETLYEIDMLYKNLAERLGIELRRAPALNSHPGLIAAFREMVLEKKKELGW